jgi:hypothetical protein
MPEPLTIYVCMNGHVRESAHPHAVADIRNGPAAYSCSACVNTAQRVRVFHEDDVRPLWDAAKALPLYATTLPAGHRLVTAADAFPAPAEWTEDEPRA